MITWDDFEKVELRIGTIIEVTDFPEARKPAYKLRVDFGSDIGIRKSSAQLTGLYGKEEVIHGKANNYQIKLKTRLQAMGKPGDNGNPQIRDRDSPQ